MLKVGRANKNCIYRTGFVEFFIISESSNIMPHFILQKCSPFFAAFFPDVRNGNDIKIHILIKLHKWRDMRRFVAIGKANHPYPNAVVCANNTCITTGTKSQRTHISSGNSLSRLTNKFSSGIRHSYQFMVDYLAIKI